MPRFSRREIITVAAVALAILVPVLLVAYRAAYREWPWTTYPTYLHVCDRDFQPSGYETREHIEADGNHLVRVGDAPGPLNFTPLWTYAVHGQSDLPGGCNVVMWLQGGQDMFRAYSLEGGP